MRVQALLKRSSPSDIFTYKDIEVDTINNTVLKNAEKIDLTNKERLILSVLLDTE